MSWGCLGNILISRGCLGDLLVICVGHRHEGGSQEAQMTSSWTSSSQYVIMNQKYLHEEAETQSPNYGPNLPVTGYNAGTKRSGAGRI